MQDFSIRDVRFRRTDLHKCQVIVHGQTVGEVNRTPDPFDPAAPYGLQYRIDLYDGANGPCFVHHRSQIRLAIADWLWSDGIVPAPLAPTIASAANQPRLPLIR